MSILDERFQDLRLQARKAFVPFVTAGDPDLEFTAGVVRELARVGASLCEIGFPYSDPIADGPVIQASYARALAAGTRVPDILDMTRDLAPQLTIPLVGMLSYSIVRRKSPAQFAQQAALCGLAGLIVPDLPGEESSELAAACRDSAISLIQLIAPTTSPDRARRILPHASGFIYLVSSTGLTGERTEIPRGTIDRVHWLRQETDLPICIGFGISQPEQVAQLAEFADGVIVGSAIVRCLATADSRSQALSDVSDLVQRLSAPLR
jgi:tryptophan synthase alpha chain